jgi:predicted HicB family RNase H-like nuclease
MQTNTPPAILTLRIPPPIRRRTKVSAAALGLTLQQFAIEALERACEAAEATLREQGAPRV